MNTKHMTREKLATKLNRLTALDTLASIKAAADDNHLGTIANLLGIGIQEANQMELDEIVGECAARIQIVAECAGISV